MLIQFRVENHRSLRDEQTLSLTTTGPSAKAGPHVLRSEAVNEGVVPVAAIYGANASGKSNVLGALGFMRSAVLESQRLWEIEGTPQEPFLLSTKRREPSLYEVDIIVDDVRYRYGFQLGSARIEEEWLYAWPHERKAMWFEREGDRFEFGKTLHGENEAIRNLTRPNSLFLSTAAQSNHAALLPIFRYFDAWRVSLLRHAGMSTASSLSVALARRLAGPDLAANAASSADATGLTLGTGRMAILQLLQNADTGILDIRVEPPRIGLTLEEIAAIIATAQQKIQKIESPVTQTYQGDPDAALSELLELWSKRATAAKGKQRPAPDHPTVMLRHRTSDGGIEWLPLELESAGTLALLELAPYVIDTLREGGLLCIDELEASLHPSLALHMVRMFNDPDHNKRNGQLVFATHDTNLLGTLVGEPVLQRDQIWFTEKDQEGATHLYPLTDFHPRKEENLERGYLQGRYGAVPFLGELVDSARLEPERSRSAAKPQRRKTR